MDGRAFFVMFVCFMAICLVGCQSGQKTSQAPAPVSQAELAYPKPAPVQQPAVAQAPREFMMQPVYFGTGKHQITPEGSTALRKDAEWLKQNPQVKVQISGNADQRGSEPYNQQLAQKRADAVKKQLVQSGVSPDRIQTFSNGMQRPVCSQDTPDCYAENRRVDMRAMG